MSSLVVVLTEALTRRFYLGCDPTDTRCWRTAFGLGPRPGRAGRVARRDPPRRHRPPVRPPVRDPFRAMLMAEQTAVDAVHHSYTSSPAPPPRGRRPRRSAKHGIPPPEQTSCCGTGTCWTGRCSARRRIRPRRGAAVPAGHDQDGHRRGHAGRRPHSRPRFYAPLTAASMTGDRLTGSFTEQRGAVRSHGMLRDAATSKTSVLVTTEPYLGSTPRVHGGRWRNPDAAGRLGAVAAAPSGAARRRPRRSVMTARHRHQEH